MQNTWLESKKAMISPRNSGGISLSLAINPTKSLMDLVGWMKQYRRIAFRAHNGKYLCCTSSSLREVRLAASYVHSEHLKSCYRGGKELFTVDFVEDTSICTIRTYTGEYWGVAEGGPLLDLVPDSSDAAQFLVEEVGGRISFKSLNTGTYVVVNPAVGTLCVSSVSALKELGAMAMFTVCLKGSLMSKSTKKWVTCGQDGRISAGKSFRLSNETLLLHLAANSLMSITSISGSPWQVSPSSQLHCERPQGADAPKDADPLLFELDIDAGDKLPCGSLTSEVRLFRHTTSRNQRVTRDAVKECDGSLVLVAVGEDASAAAHSEAASLFLLHVVSGTPSDESGESAMLLGTSRLSVPDANADQMDDLDSELHDAEMSRIALRATIKRSRSTIQGILTHKPAAHIVQPALQPGEKFLVVVTDIGFFPRRNDSMVIGSLFITNYALMFCEPKETFNWTMPLMCVSQVLKVQSDDESSTGAFCAFELRSRELTNMRLCELPVTSMMHSSDLSRGRDLLALLKDAVFPSNLSALFCFRLAKQVGPLPSTFRLEEELKRMHLTTLHWRVCSANDTFTICPTYPRVFAVPAILSDERVASIANAYAANRLPVATWRSPDGCVLSRGIVRLKTVLDESFLTVYRDKGRTLVVYDIVEKAKVTESCRKSVAVDASVELLSILSHNADHATTAPQHMHRRRTVLKGIKFVNAKYSDLRRLCIFLQYQVDEAHEAKGLHSTGWLHQLCTVMRVAVEVTDMLVRGGMSVCVRCGSGKDRSAQVCSLVQVMADPHARTFVGFRAMIEKEWIQMGYPFNTRHGILQDKSSVLSEEEAPIFLQFVDSVQQLAVQFPTAFEFNELFLITMMHHLYSCKYGTFLLDSERDRQIEQTRLSTVDWFEVVFHSLASGGGAHFRNPAYTPVGVLIPQCESTGISLWGNYYMPHVSSVVVTKNDG